MRLFDVGHGLGVVIQPHIAKDRVPSEADQLMKNHENPNGQMIDSSAHGPIICKHLLFRQDEITIRAS